MTLPTQPQDPRDEAELEKLIRKELRALSGRVLTNLQPGTYSTELPKLLNELVEEGTYALPRAIAQLTQEPKQ